MIEVERLTKYYGRLPAIQDVNFRVQSGEIVGFLGPNGAGKTTTMRILTCFSPASSGEARILGMDVRNDSLKIRQNIGYLPENVPLYSWMRVRDYLRFVGRSKGVDRSKREQEVEKVASDVGISDVMNRIIKGLSKGYRQRVGLAQALMGNPPILILDEPTIGLDPRQIREIRELVKSFSQNRTVILSTHILPEVSQVCDRVIIINKGSIIAEDSPAGLAKTHGKSSRCKLVVQGPKEDVSTLLSSVKGVISVEPSAESDNGAAKFLVAALPDTDVCPEIARAVVNKGWDLLEMTPLVVSLEDVFIDLVTEESGDGQSSDHDLRKETTS
jgi:ABC-2 type transport system ATP-binding protein